MGDLWTIASLYAVKWIGFSRVDDKWKFLTAMLFLVAAVVLSVLLRVANTSSDPRYMSLQFRAGVAVVGIGAWLDFGKYLLWNYGGERFDISAPLAIIFLAWFIHVISRMYKLPAVNINPANVCLLVHKPKGITGIIKSLMFLPMDSICVYANGNVWAFRRNSNIFEWSAFNEGWLKNHFIIDTGIHVDILIVSELNKVLGEQRSPYCKCIWAIRNALKQIGREYAVQHWYEYYPPLYLSRILTR